MLSFVSLGLNAITLCHKPTQTHFSLIVILKIKKYDSFNFNTLKIWNELLNHDIRTIKKYAEPAQGNLWPVVKTLR